MHDVLRKQGLCQMLLKVLGLIVTALLVGLFLYFVLYYPYAFNYEINIDHYHLLLPLMFGMVVLVLLYFICLRTISNRPGIWLLAITIAICAGIGAGYGFGNEYATVLLVVSLAFIIAALLYNKRWMHWLLAGILLVYGYEMALGIYQWITLEPYQAEPSLLITGSLLNSGIYACYLIAHFPLVHYVAGKIKKKPWLVLTVYMAVLLWLVILTGSRTALLALVIVVIGMQRKRCLVFFRQYWPAFWFKAAMLVTITAGIGGGWYLYKLKQLSAIGRLLGWQIALGHWRQQFWLGVGLGRFTWYYPQWQMEYFNKHPDPSTGYLLSAGESYLVFNEYIQLFKETGLVGIVLFLLSLYYLFRARSTKNAPLISAMKFTILAILSCAFTSYPFHSTALLFILFFCCMGIMVLCDDRLIVHWRLPHRVIFALLFAGGMLGIANGMYVSIACIKVSKAAYTYHRLQENDRDGQEQQKTMYAAIYPILKHDGKFLTAYGEWLVKDSNTGNEGIAMLEKAKRSFIGLRTVQAVADAYMEKHDYAGAIINYEWLSNYLPNRFKIKFTLLQLYIEKKDTTKAKDLARLILTMPVKIPSQQVFDIRENTRQILDTLNAPSFVNIK